MISRALIDETGMGMDKPVFAMGGFLADVDTWKRVTDAWQGELDESPKLPAIHMTCLYQGTKGFEHIDHPEMYRRLSKLARIIVGCGDIYPFIVSVEAAKWREAVESKLCRCKRRRFEHPYEFFCQMIAVKALQLGEYVKRDFGCIDFVFDYQQKLGSRTKSTIDDELPRFLATNYPELRPRLGELLWPRERQNYQGLQAADVMMWQHRRHLSSETIPNDAVYKQLALAGRVSTILDMDEQLRKRAAFVLRRKCKCGGKR